MVRGVSILRGLPIAQLAEPQFFVKFVARIHCSNTKEDGKGTVHVRSQKPCVLI